MSVGDTSTPRVRLAERPAVTTNLEGVRQQTAKQPALVRVAAPELYVRRQEMVVAVRQS
jgi:hypothetical protein